LRKYETIIVIDSLLKADETESIISKYERFISANGGQVEAIERWGKRRLAYEIKKRQYGFYVLIRFDGQPTMIKQLEREYRLNESLLRYATIKLDDRALKALEKQKSLGYIPRTGSDEPKIAPLPVDAPSSIDESSKVDAVEVASEPEAGSAELFAEAVDAEAPVSEQASNNQAIVAG